MNDLINLQSQQIQALQAELAKYKNLLADAKELLQNIVNDLEVVDEEVIGFPYLDEATKVFDEAFDNPIDQLNDILRCR
jgi:conjugal transfer/entry exclusion protein